LKLEGFQYAMTLDQNMGYYHIKLWPFSKHLWTMLLHRICAWKYSSCAITVYWHCWCATPANDPWLHGPIGLAQIQSKILGCL
jgi:hypothetical protein